MTRTLALCALLALGALPSTSPAQPGGSPETVDDPAEEEINSAAESDVDHAEREQRGAVPSVDMSILTASPASAAAAWPGVWGEGGAEHRAALASRENEAVTVFDRVDWLRGPIPDLSSPEVTVLLVHFGHWTPRINDELNRLAGEIVQRRAFGAHLVALHPEVASEELAAAIAAVRPEAIIGIDRGNVAREALLVDSYPDHFVLGDGGRLLCGDIRTGHAVHALDAVLAGWRPWHAAAGASAEAETVAASPEAD